MYRAPNTYEKVALKRYAPTIEKGSVANNYMIIGTDQNFDFIKLDVHN